jgi:endonuclease-8
VDGERPNAGAGSQPVADELAVEDERASGTAFVRRPLPRSGERAVGDADGGQIEDGAEVDRQAGAARMVATGGVDDQDARPLRQGPNGRFEQRPLAEGEQARLVGGSCRSGDDRRLGAAAGEQRRRRPARVAGRPGTALAPRKADEATGRHGLGGRVPGWRPRCRELELRRPELFGRVGPGGHRAIFADVPEGDAIHRAANTLRVLVGERVAVETPHPRAAATGVAERLDGRRLLGVEAVGKNLLLRFEDDLVLRSHLRMSGRWRVGPPGTRRVGRPWLVLRGSEHEAVLWGGPVLELHTRAVSRLGPDILAEPPDFEAMLRRLRAEYQGRAVGDALLDQRLVSGIGNVWKAESLWRARVSPWRPLADVSDDELLAVLDYAAKLMRQSVQGGRDKRAVYRRVGKPCPRCRTPIRSRGQGDANRMAYWCPQCQEGEDPPGA